MSCRPLPTWICSIPSKENGQETNWSFVQLFLWTTSYAWFRNHLEWLVTKVTIEYNFFKRWDSIFLQIPLLATQLIPTMSVNRNVVDESISKENNKRDYNIWINDILVVCGEDRKAGEKLPTDELKMKSSYGELYFFKLTTI